MHAHDQIFLGSDVVRSIAHLLTVTRTCMGSGDEIDALYVLRSARINNKGW